MVLGNVLRINGHKIFCKIQANNVLFTGSSSGQVDNMY